MNQVFAAYDLSKNPISPNVTSLADIINIVIKNAFTLAGLIAFIVLVFGGFSVIMGAGAGDTKKMEKGKNAITGAVIGILIIVASIWIIQILERITGQTILNNSL